MSRPKSTKRKRRPTTRRGSRKPGREISPQGLFVIGLFSIVLGFIMFLALVSYTPDDLPAWMPFSRVAEPNSPEHNFIGKAGVYFAGVWYFLFGAAAYLTPAAVVWFGVYTMLSSRLIMRRHLLGAVGLILTGACLVNFQSSFLQDWPRVYNLFSTGGWVGYALGEKVFLNILGPVGAPLVLGGVYVGSLIYVTGLHPIQFFASLKRTAATALGWIRQRRLERADTQERLALEERRLEQEEKKLRRKIKKAGAAAGEKSSKSKSKPEEPAPMEEPELPLEPLPEPKIIDASVRKPSIAEAMKKNREKSKPRQILHGDAFQDYKLPGLDFFQTGDEEEVKAANPDELRAVQNTIIRTLGEFGITVSPGDITRGPTITRYEVYPSQGLRVNRITALEADIARATRAERINILAPIPGKDTVGIEIANSLKVAVLLRELLEDPEFGNHKGSIPLALGKDVYGNTIIADLAKMPHLLVARATGSGKSVCINSIISSLLFQFTPDQLRFIMVDPKVVEMQTYNDLPHLALPVVTDPKKVLLALRWVINEMENRYQVFAKAGVRNVSGYNLLKPEEKTRASRNLKKAAAAQLAAAPPAAAKRPSDPDGDPGLDLNLDEIPEEPALVHAVQINDDLPLEEDELEMPDRLPLIIVIIDELADLMQTAPADVELAISRIAQKARAAGIHLIVATQTPRADVITGVIKANIPSRIAFQVASKIDSRVILDTGGAERLVGQGDMLYLPPGSSKLLRAQGALVTDPEIEDLVEFCSSQCKPIFDADITECLEGDGPEDEDVSPEDEELLEKCIEVVAQEKRASTSLLQRRLRIGYTRAARMVDILEMRGIVGPGEGAKPREILVDLSIPVE